MLNFLFNLDTQLFLFINHLPHNLFLDYFFGALTFVGEAGAIWFFLSFFLFAKNLASQGYTLRSYETKKLAVIWLTGLFALLPEEGIRVIFESPKP